MSVHVWAIGLLHAVMSATRNVWLGYIISVRVNGYLFMNHCIVTYLHTFRLCIIVKVISN